LQKLEMVLIVLDVILEESLVIDFCFGISDSVSADSQFLGLIKQYPLIIQELSK